MTITVATNNARIRYTATSGQTAFAIPFEFFENDEIYVYVAATTLVAADEKTQGTGSTHYAVSGGGGSTGTVTFVTGITESYIVTIVRDIPIERITDFTAGSTINRAALNTQLDTLTAMVGDLKDKSDRAIRLQPYDSEISLFLPTIANRAGKIFGFDTNGNLTADTAANFDITLDDLVMNTMTMSGNANSKVNLTAVLDSQIVTNGAVLNLKSTKSSNTADIKLDGSATYGIDFNAGNKAIRMQDATLFSSTIESSGAATLSSVVTSTITSTGDVAIDAAGDITLDADGGEIYFKDDGALRLTFQVSAVAATLNSASDFNLNSANDIALKPAGGQVDILGTSGEQRILFDNAASPTMKYFQNSNTTTLGVVNPTGTRALLLPDASDTLVGKDTTDTLTNKTLTSPTITGSLDMSDVNITNVGSISLDKITNDGGAGITLDSSVGIVLDAGSGQIVFKDDNVTRLTVAVNSSSSQSITSLAGLKLNSGTDITLEADGGQVYITDPSGNDNFQFNGAASPTLGIHQNSNVTNLGLVDPTATRTILFPDASDTLVGKATTDTLTNKTLTAPTLTGTAVVASLDISGDIDVDGTTNLDVVDIDGAVDFASTTAHAGNASFADNAKAIFGAGSDLQIYHDGSNSYVDDTGTGRLYLRGNDRVQIQKYTGEDMITANADGAVNLYYDNSKKFETTNTGVDITGTLAVTGANAATMSIIAPTDNATLEIRGGNSDSAVEEANVVFYQNNAAKWQLGNATDNSFKLYNYATSSYAVTIESSGNLVIETGSDLITNSASGTTNTRIGTTAGDSIVASNAGLNNVLIGVNAGTALDSGDSNIAIGYHALKTEDDHANNIAIGAHALETQNAGQDGYNVAVGYNAGADITDGLRNVIIGGIAGDQATTIDDCVIIGYNAGGNATMTGHDNVLVGKDSGQEMAAGQQNIMIGVDCGQATNDGHSNVAIGHTALFTNQDGDGQVAVGFEALYTSEPADGQTYNVAVGYRAGKGVSSGHSNTIIGGLTCQATLTGNANVIVGTEAGNDLTSGFNNTALGYTALSENTASGANVAIGYQSMKVFNSTANASHFNTAVGVQSGLSLSTGIQNTMLGGLAGAYATTTDGSTFVGYQAAQGITGTKLTGNNNTAIGSQAGLVLQGAATNNTLVGKGCGEALTVGNDNTAVGRDALTADTKGGSTVAIGDGALSTQNFTSATDVFNVAVGRLAGEANATGTSNTFIGGLAGRNVTGSSNTAVGAAAMDAAVSGTQNTAVGVNALGAANGAANNNTAVGVQAGASVTTGDNNLLLGLDAGQTGSPGGAITTASNEIGLGDENISAANIQVDWTVASDQRDKTDFTDLDLGLDFVKALAPVTYKWDKRSKYGDKYADDYDLNAQTPDGTHKEDWLDIGFKAQEVQALEEAAGYTTAAKKNLTVSTSDDGKQYGLQYSKFVPILVKAIQEQNALIEALTARIETLEG